MSKGKGSTPCNTPEARAVTHSTAGKAGGSGVYKANHCRGGSPWPHKPPNMGGFALLPIWQITTSSFASPLRYYRPDRPHQDWLHRVHHHDA